MLPSARVEIVTQFMTVIGNNFAVRAAIYLSCYGIKCGANIKAELEKKAKFRYNSAILKREEFKSSSRFAYLAFDSSI